MSGWGQTGLNGGRCQELIALGCSGGLCVYSNLTHCLHRAERCEMGKVRDEMEGVCVCGGGLHMSGHYRGAASSLLHACHVVCVCVCVCMRQRSCSPLARQPPSGRSEADLPPAADFHMMK